MHTVAPFWRAAALILPLVAANGCDWIPARRRISPSLYPVPSRPDGAYIRTDRVAGRPPADPADPARRVASEDARPIERVAEPSAKPSVLPALFPITSEEALAAPPPTPMLDAALARAEEVRAAVLGPDPDPDAMAGGDAGIEPAVEPIDFEPVPTADATAADASTIEVPSPPEEAEHRSGEAPSGPEMGTGSESARCPSPVADATAEESSDEGTAGPDRASPDAVAPPEVASDPDRPGDGGHRIDDAKAEDVPLDDATEKGGGLRTELERIFDEAEARAGPDGDVIEARRRALDWLDEAEASGEVDESTLWETVMTMLAEPAEVDAEAPPTPPGSGVVGMSLAATLRIADARFCRDIRGFGRVSELDAEHLRAGGNVILYCELEGVRYIAGGDAYVSRVAATLEIVPEAGGAAGWRELRIADDRCSRPRRDYYVGYWIAMPEALPPGRYRLNIHQRDESSGAEAAGSLPFVIEE